jgi:hypothetical protein
MLYGDSYAEDHEDENATHMLYALSYDREPDEDDKKEECIKGIIDEIYRGYSFVFNECIKGIIDEIYRGYDVNTSFTRSLNVEIPWGDRSSDNEEESRLSMAKEPAERVAKASLLWHTEPTRKDVRSIFYRECEDLKCLYDGYVNCVINFVQTFIITT